MTLYKPDESEMNVNRRNQKMINLRPKLEDMIVSVKEHIILLEQANKSTEKFEMLLKTLQDKQAKRPGRMDVKEVKQAEPDDSDIDLVPQIEVEIDDLDEIICLDFEPLQPKANPWDDLIRKNENGSEEDKC